MDEQIKKAILERTNDFKKMYPNLTETQVAFLVVFENSSCNVSVAMSQIKMARQTYYDWINNSKEFSAANTEIIEGQIDYAESKLQSNIREQKEASIFFFLKTRGKHRGYVEKSEIAYTNDDWLELMERTSKQREKDREQREEIESGRK